MKPQLRNWQTTVVGLLLAVLTTISELSAGKEVSDWRTWILPAALAALGFLSRDAGKSTEDSTL
jgi:hypothetical protein